MSAATTRDATAAKLPDHSTAPRSDPLQVKSLEWTVFALACGLLSAGRGGRRALEFQTRTTSGSGESGTLGASRLLPSQVAVALRLSKTSHRCVWATPAWAKDVGGSAYSS